MEKPLLSICLITYNHEKFIRQALESIAAQQVNFVTELIIADDRSKDDTPKIITDFLTTYSGAVRILNRERNLGPAANFIDMIGAASGKYVAYLEGDDYWIGSYKLQRQVDFLEAHSNIALSAHNSIVLPVKDEPHIFNKSTKYSNKPYNSIYAIEDYIIKDFFHSSAIVYRRSMLGAFPDWYAKAFGGDYFLVLFLAMNGGIHYINEPLSAYRTNTNSISHHHSLFEINKNFNHHFEKFNEYSGYKYKKWISETVFTRRFGIYYYHPSYFVKFKFALKNLLRIVQMNKSAFPPLHRIRIFLPTFLIRSRTDLFKKRASESN